MKALLALAVLAAGCGEDNCRDADAHLNNTGICVVNSQKSRYSVEQLDIIYSREISVFDRIDRHDTNGKEEWRYILSSRQASLEFSGEPPCVSGANGRTHFKDDGESVTIVINELDDTDLELKTLTHELLHVAVSESHGERGHVMPWFNPIGEFYSDSDENVILEDARLQERDKRE